MWRQSDIPATVPQKGWVGLVSRTTGATYGQERGATMEDTNTQENVQTNEENVNEEPNVDLSKYEQNLQGEPKENDTSKLIEMLDKQDAVITQLKTQIKDLKELNMALALKTGTGDEPHNAVDTLNAVYGASKK